MKTGIALFTYNRSYHLQQVLDGLKENVIADTLYIFQDGLKNKLHRQGWQEVRTLINRISWCEKKCYFSDYNKGLAQSIVDGINIVLKENDAIIILEDDCVPEKNFIGFMHQCFEKYKDNNKVYSISGYAWPIDILKSQYDVYGCGRVSSWGWGTWKDRWSIYEKDYELVKRLKRNKEMSRNLAAWGNDLEEILVGNVKGEYDSWAVFWALNVILKEGICINPYHSLIKNIGMDGTGVHCGVTTRFDIDISGEGKKYFNLPEDISCLGKTIEAFAALYGSYTVINKQSMEKEKVLVYGLGNFFLEKEKAINEEYWVEAFVDHKKRGWFAGKQIITLAEIDQYEYKKIIIMVKDKRESRNIAKSLMERNINMDDILLGCNLYES